MPASFTRAAKQIVDPEYQRALFDVGFAAGRAGNTWMDMPPGQTPDN